MSEAVNHPDHYGGEENPYEAIKVIEAWRLGFCLGNTVKYISRAGKKDPEKVIEDLKKAAWYLSREIIRLQEQQDSNKTQPQDSRVLHKIHPNGKTFCGLDFRIEPNGNGFVRGIETIYLTTDKSLVTCPACLNSM